jgi:hypothetical protein
MSAGLRGRPVRGVVRLPEAVAQPATVCGSTPGRSGGSPVPACARGRGRGWVRRGGGEGVRVA